MRSPSSHLFLPLLADWSIAHHSHARAPGVAQGHSGVRRICGHEGSIAIVRAD
jgi:hypothetical protein